MKRGSSIIGLLLALTCSVGHGKSCGYISAFSASSSGRLRPDASVTSRVMTNNHLQKNDSSQAKAYESGPRLSTVACYANQGNNAEEEDDQSNSKRGVFRRVREKLSSTFGGNKKADEGQNEGTSKDAGYKPNPFDGLRLKLAMAMSNFKLLQSRDEWVVACPKTRVGPGQIVPCVVNGLDIIIFASRDGQRLDAFANACPHLGSPFDLATIVQKPPKDQEKGQPNVGAGAGNKCVDCIVCPVHQTAFEIQSGKVRGEWCPYPPVLGGIV